MEVSKEDAHYEAKSKHKGSCSKCVMFMPRESCSLVMGTISPSGWRMFFDKKPDAKLRKAKEMSDFQVFLPIAKVDKEKRTVSGYASTPTKDSDGEIVTLEAIRNALPDYMAYGNIREMHALKAVGVAQEANMDTKGVWLSAKIVDDGAWKKCLEGVYKGFSIGGRKLAKQGDKITEIDWTETSIVDRPANGDCKISLAKSAKTLEEEAGYLIKIKQRPSPEAKALVKMAKIVEGLAKAGPPAAHDGFSLPAKPNGGELGPNDSRPDENLTRKAGDDSTPCEAHGKIGCEKCAVEKREFDAKERREAADSGAAMPDGSFPIKNAEDLSNAIRLAGHGKNPGKAKAHIKARAKALGLTDKLPDDWSKSKEAKKLAKRHMLEALGIKTLKKTSSEPEFFSLKKGKDIHKDSPFDLKKGMSSAGSLAYCFDSIRTAQRQLMIEAKREGGDMKDKALGLQLGKIAKDLADVISQKASHEGEEATTLTDVDDQYLVTILGEDFDMSKVNELVSTGDPLADAVATLMKRAAMPTKAQCMKVANEEVDKARKAMKECRKAVEEVHKMCKASYINKMQKAKGGSKDDDGDGFDHADAMSKLQKAYDEANKARTFGKAAMAQIAKAESIPGRSGQRGQEAADPEAGFYEVPSGVTDLTPAAMSGAAPGTKSGGSQPPMYPTDGGVFPGKAAGTSDLQKFAKNGLVSAEVAALIMEKARTEGELEALRRVPAPSLGGRRPFAFDMTKMSGGQGGNNPNISDMNKALFDGVNPHAFSSGDEREYTQASARAIGNLLTNPGLFGKSLFDPSFKGSAGIG